ncbi:DUF1684 domain-containing protein [Myceligenerans crystallogenes]
MTHTTDRPAPAAPAAPASRAAHDPAAAHAAWHAARTADLRSPQGWLTLSSLHWPGSAPARLPGLPGQWWVDGGALRTWPHAAADDAAPGAFTGADVVDGRAAVQVAEGGSTILGTFLPAGRPDDDDHRVAVEVALRTGRYAIRTRDPRAPGLAGFEGVPLHPYDPAWVLDTPVIWYGEPEPVVVGAAQPRLVHHLEAVGEVEVVVAGRATRLTLTGTYAAPVLLFGDEGADHAPWRGLWPVVSGVVPGTSGVVRLDLNRTVNLPYAFTDFGTCPAPPAGNHLPYEVAAGEKAPRKVLR